MRTVGKKFKKKAAEPNKAQLMKTLAEKGIEFDKKATVEELKALLPKE